MSLENTSTRTGFILFCHFFSYSSPRNLSEDSRECIVCFPVSQHGFLCLFFYISLELMYQQHRCYAYVLADDQILMLCTTIFYVTFLFLCTIFPSNLFRFRNSFFSNTLFSCSKTFFWSLQMLNLWALEQRMISY